MGDWSERGDMAGGKRRFACACCVVEVDIRMPYELCA